MMMYRSDEEIKGSHRGEIEQSNNTRGVIVFSLFDKSGASFLVIGFNAHLIQENDSNM